MPELVAVVVTYRRPTELARTLALLGEQHRRLDQIVVVDNGDGEGKAVAEASTAAPRVHYVAASDNLGPAGGIELGMQEALSVGGPDAWILVVDDDDPPPDAEVLGDLEAALGRWTQRRPRLGGLALAGATLDWHRGRLHAAEPGDADYLKSNWFPLYRAAAVRDVGPFDGSLFFGFDDLEFGLRMRAAGWDLIADPLGRTVPVGPSDPSWWLPRMDWRRYYSLRNLIWILRRHGRAVTAARLAVVVGVAKPLANMARHPRLAIAHLAQNLRAVHDGWRGRLGRTVQPDGTERAVPIPRAASGYGPT